MVNDNPLFTEYILKKETEVMQNALECFGSREYNMCIFTQEYNVSISKRDSPLIDKIGLKKKIYVCIE